MANLMICIVSDIRGEKVEDIFRDEDVDSSECFELAWSRNTSNPRPFDPEVARGYHGDIRVF